MSRELLFSVTKKDFKVDYFSGTGSGGQHRNKHQNCVRIHHVDSGVIGVGQSHRERKANRREALDNIVNNPVFKLWHTRRTMECLEGKTIEQKVDELLRPKNLRVEVRRDGRWELIDNDK